METQVSPIDTPCCSTFYEQDWVRSLAEDIFHPGGAELTLKTVSAMGLSPVASLIDLGCGTGSSAIKIERLFDFGISAIDASAANIERACQRVDPSVSAIRFLQSGVHDMPFDDGKFDGVLAECTFSLFPDQPAVLDEIRRILKPAGKLAITDMATGGRLPSDIQDVLAPWTCLKDAVTERDYLDLFQVAGFRVLEVSDESWGLKQLILQLKRKLLLMGTGSLLGAPSIPGLDPASIKYWLNRAREEVDAGRIRYLRFQLIKS